MSSQSHRSEVDVSVVVPALNEGKNVGPLIDRIWSTMRILGLKAEILIIDGGSTDETWRIAESKGAHCILQRRLGYGGALREGFQNAHGEYVLTMDCDLSHPPELAQTLWPERVNADVIVGSRFVPGGSSKAPPVRSFLSQVLNFVFMNLLAFPVRDSSSGYRLYKRSVLRPDLYGPENFNILQEILVRAYTDGFKIKEIPLAYEPRASGVSHVSIAKFALSYLPTLYRLWKLRNSTDAADYEFRAFSSRHPLQRYWIRTREQLLHGFHIEGARTLDIGSGSSHYTATRPECIALDINSKKLRFLGTKVRNRIQADAWLLPFADASFEQVVVSQTLSYVKRISEALKEINRVLKPGGTLIVAVPDSRRIGWRILGALYHSLPNIAPDQVQNKFARSTLVDLLADKGFRSLKYQYICGSELILKCKKIADA